MTCMTTAYTSGGKDFSRSREREPSISVSFIRLNELDYKKAEQSDRLAEVIETTLSVDKLRARSSYELSITRRLQLRLNKKLRLHIVASVNRL